MEMTRKISRRRRRRQKWANRFLKASIVLVVLAVLNAIQVVQYQYYENPEYGFRIKYPKHWYRMDYPAKKFHVVVAFITPRENSMDIFSDNMNIIVTDLRENPMSLEQFSKEVIEGLTSQVDPFIKVTERRRTEVGGYPGVRFGFVPRHKGEGFRFLHVIVVAKGRGYTISYGAITSDFNKYIRIVNKMIKSMEFI